jgi:membrane-associated phospholipid phosphatase
MKNVVFLLVVLFCSLKINAQDEYSDSYLLDNYKQHVDENYDKDNLPKDMYKVNYRIETPLTAVLHIGNYFGFRSLRNKEDLGINEIKALDKNDVWAIDRIALNQTTEQRLRAHNTSDWGLNSSFFLPLFLFLENDIRSEWMDITLMYLEAHGVNSQVYVWGGPRFIKRIRPFVYYEKIPDNLKMENGATDAWFSGHVSSTATSSFFTAKVYCDFHPELGAKKWLLYGAAVIPPAFVAYYRVRALKHFPTDVFVGAVVGAAFGILGPELHKINYDKHEISVVPYVGEYSGIYVNLTL